MTVFQAGQYEWIILRRLKWDHREYIQAGNKLVTN
jgi:hypothetical protein